MQITYLQHLNRVLTDEAAYGNHLLAPVIEPDRQDPYSATPRRLYDPASGEEHPAAQHPPPISADLQTPSKNPFLGATLESCAAYLRASASIDPAWDVDMFAVLDGQYLACGTVLVAHSYVAGDESKYAPDYIRCFHNGVQA